MTFKLACVQLNVQDDAAANIAVASALIRRARDAGAQFIATPENTGGMVAPGSPVAGVAFAEAEHPALAAYRVLARETGAWLLLGSLWVTVEGGARVANRQFLLGPDGAVQARYDKIHMFDVDLPNGEQYRESARFAPGATALVSDTPFGTLGHSICYDVRFPHLYRGLAQAGAQFIAVPAAFTRPTGQAHWHILLRARAIETGAFVFAPAQTGIHPGNRGTFGHSLIIAPWGEVLADGGEETGFIIADVDTSKVAQARANVPAWNANREFALPEKGCAAAE